MIYFYSKRFRFAPSFNNNILISYGYFFLHNNMTAWKQPVQFSMSYVTLSVVNLLGKCFKLP